MRTPRRTPILQALLDDAAGSHLRAVALLVALSLLAFLPGFFRIPPVDRDEARFAQATKQMVESLDYVDIFFQDENRYKKPIGIYWLQSGVVNIAAAIGVRGAHTTIALYRIPSLAGATAAVVLTYWAALAFVPRRAAVLAASMMAASLLLGVEARLAKTDAMLLATMVAALGALGRAYTAESGAARDSGRPLLVPAVFWTALAAGFLLKGPLVLVFVGLAVATLGVFDRSLHWVSRLKPAGGVVWFLLLVLPWFAAISARSGASFFRESLGGDLVPKIGSGMDSHGMPPGYHVLLFWVTFFPGSILAGIAAPAIWRARRAAGVKFLLAWTVPAWLVFESIATKLPHYVLPVYPAIAIMIAGVVDRDELSRHPRLTRWTVSWLLITFGVAASLVAAAAILAQRVDPLAGPLAAGAVLFALRAWRRFEQDGAERALLRALTASVLLSATAFGATVPRLSSLFPSAQIARYLQTAGCVPSVASAGYHEPSLVFLAGTATRLTDGAGAADFLGSGGCRFAVVEQAEERAFVQRSAAIGLRFARGPRIDGINIGTVRRASIVLFRAEPPS